MERGLAFPNRLTVIRVAETLQAVDALATVVSTTPASPVVPSDDAGKRLPVLPTTTEPTSTDPGFKAGMDL